MIELQRIRRAERMCRCCAIQTINNHNSIHNERTYHHVYS